MKFSFILFLVPWEIESFLRNKNCVQDNSELKIEEISGNFGQKLNKNSHSFRKLQSEELHQLKILFSTEFADQTAIIARSAEWDVLKNTIIPMAESFFIERLKVYTSSSETTISTSQPCSNLNLPTEVTSNGNKLPNGKNFLMYVQPVTSKTYVAMATACLQGDLHNRPIAGKIQINLDLYSTRSERLEEYFSTFIHECLHNLGFNQLFFPHFIDRSTSANNKYDLSSIYKQNVQIRGLSTNLVSSPKVLQEAKDHFKCSTLEGLELENEDSSTHWDYRVIGNEMMNAAEAHSQPFSRLSAAFFEDSGWYVANYTGLPAISWGKNEGCAYLFSSCLDSGTLKPKFEEFCEVKDKVGCTDDLLAVAKCSGASSSTNNGIDPDINYFGNFSYHADYRDNCPSFKSIYPYENGLCMFEHLKQHMNYSYDAGFGINSRCFTGTWMREKAEEYHNGCLETRCTTDSSNVTQLYIKASGKEYLCPKEGGSISIDNHNGSIICPPTQKACIQIVAGDQFLRSVDRLSGKKYLNIGTSSSQSLGQSEAPSTTTTTDNTKQPEPPTNTNTNTNDPSSSTNNTSTNTGNNPTTTTNSTQSTQSNQTSSNSTSNDQNNTTSNNNNNDNDNGGGLTNKTSNSTSNSSNYSINLSFHSFTLLPFIILVISMGI